MVRHVDRIFSIFKELVKNWGKRNNVKFISSTIPREREKERESMKACIPKQPSKARFSKLSHKFVSLSLFTKPRTRTCALNHDHASAILAPSTPSRKNLKEGGKRGRKAVETKERWGEKFAASSLWGEKLWGKRSLAAVETKNILKYV